MDKVYNIEYAVLDKTLCLKKTTLSRQKPKADLNSWSAVHKPDSLTITNF